ncbi:hypothetical protein NDU88_008032 [Pleurodeles waltl]|uniref:Uncharacterized protein n=1 Tax=Pleurodeles waltl TaxID=8319 RepID=A0AAV7RR58_PLEWA|nr:hypothetical protein NDU88_008032 [Pleurodeles waltl]
MGKLRPPFFKFCPLPQLGRLDVNPLPSSRGRQTIGTIQDSPEKHSLRSEQRTEYVKPKKDSQHSSEVSVKEEEKLLQQKPQFKKKKVAAVNIRHATQEEGFTEEQEVGTGTA